MTTPLPNRESTASETALRVVIADDEYLCRERIKVLLKSEPNVQVVAECSELRQTVAALQNLHPDLVLLDIEMPGGSGFEILETVVWEDRPRVIFTTAYDHYAVKAFEARALDYLLKPFDRQRFHDALDRARADILKFRQNTMATQGVELIRQTHHPPNERFIVKSKGRVIFLNPRDIDWVEAAANYVRLHTESGSYLVRETIGQVAQRLEGSQFARIHRSIVVNLIKIREVVPCNSGEYIVVLQTGKEVPCSRKYRASIKNLLAKS
jgi:two-component system LytT family response regulator